MIFSYYLFKAPYTLCWQLMKKLKKLDNILFYCGDPLDFYVFEPVRKYLDQVTYVTDKPDIMEFLYSQSIDFKTFPVFPKAVIMARHSTYKFPCKHIVKIGLRHGAYHFKKMTSAENYNAFDLYLMTSKADVNAGVEIGITCAKAVGFPKLDAVISGDYDDFFKSKLMKRLGFNTEKKVILFTATYDSSGMSAIKLWYKKLYHVRDTYNVLVSLHPWVDDKFRHTIEAVKGVFLIKEINVIPYIYVTDVVIGDTSSILAECCAMNKPMITFKQEKAKRSLDEISELLDKISYRITGFDELNDKIKYALENPDELEMQRIDANHLMFDDLDGKAGQRAALEIKKLLEASEII